LTQYWVSKISYFQAHIVFFYPTKGYKSQIAIALNQ